MPVTRLCPQVFLFLKNAKIGNFSKLPGSVLLLSPARPGRLELRLSSISLRLALALRQTGTGSRAWRPESLWPLRDGLKA